MSQIFKDSSGPNPPPPSGRFPITPYVVGPLGEAGYQTIQSAIDAANVAGGGAVYIQQGTYNESLTLYDQVNLVAVPAISQGIDQGVTINGTHTPPNSGHVLMNGICFISTTSVFSSNAAGSTHLTVANCESAVQNGYLFNVPNWTGTLEIYDCNPATSGAPWAINDGCVNNTGGSTVIIYNSGGGNGTNVMTVSGANSFFGQAVTIGCPINLVTGANVTSIGSEYFGSVTLSNNSVMYSTNDSFISGATAAITMNSSGNSSFANSVIDSTNNPAIDGSGVGVLSLSGNSFLNDSRISSSLTISYGQIYGNPNSGITSVTTTPYVVSDMDYFLSVNTSSSKTIQLPDSPATGQQFVVKDATGNSVANNITITTVGGTVLIDGATSTSINSSYESVTVIFDGTKYLVW